MIMGTSYDLGLNARVTVPLAQVPRTGLPQTRTPRSIPYL
jgi:hypothetical protein